MQGGQRSARRSSMSLPGKSTAWASSSAPSASLAPGSRSAWPTWSIISSASHGSKGELRLFETGRGRKGTVHPAKPAKTTPKGSQSGCPAPAPLPQPRNAEVFRAVQLSRYVGQTRDSPGFSMPSHFLGIFGRGHIVNQLPSDTSL